MTIQKTVNCINIGIIKIERLKIKVRRSIFISNKIVFILLLPKSATFGTTYPALGP